MLSLSDCVRPPSYKKKRCFGYDTKLHLKEKLQFAEKCEVLFIAITLRFTLTRSSSTC